MRYLRGYLTDDVREKAEAYLGRDFTTTELRLYPYIQYCVMNGGEIDRSKISDDESTYLKYLIIEKHMIRRHPNSFYPTREFWMFMNDILADTYVELAEDIERDEE